jgi:hypothetical protein
MPRYLSWLALAVAAGFLVVASVEVRLHTRVPARDRTGWSRMRSATDVAHDCRTSEPVARDYLLKSRRACTSSWRRH